MAELFPGINQNLSGILGLVKVESGMSKSVIWGFSSTCFPQSIEVTATEKDQPPLQAEEPLSRPCPRTLWLSLLPTGHHLPPHQPLASRHPVIPRTLEISSWPQNAPSRWERGAQLLPLLSASLSMPPSYSRAGVQSHCHSHFVPRVSNPSGQPTARTVHAGRMSS